MCERGGRSGAAIKRAILAFTPYTADRFIDPTRSSTSNDAAVHAAVLQACGMGTIAICAAHQNSVGEGGGRVFAKARQPGTCHSSWRDAMSFRICPNQGRRSQFLYVVWMRCC